MATQIMQNPGFWLGTIVLGWICVHVFEAPFAFYYIKDRTDSRRFAMGTMVYIYGIWVLYAVVWILFRHLSERFVAVAALGVIFIIIPILPIVSNLLDSFRNFAQTLTGFPADFENLVRVLQRPPVSEAHLSQPRPEETGNEAVAQLDKVLSRSCIGSFREAVRIHTRVSSLRSIGMNPAVVGSTLFSPRGIFSMQKYLLRRQSTLDRLEQDYSNLLHLALEVNKLDRDAGNPLNKRQLGQLSTLVAVQAEEVNSRFQRLCAQMVLAVFYGPDERKELISYLGYSVVGLVSSPPWWPIIVVIMLEFVTAAIGFALTSDFVHGGYLTGEAAIVLAQGFTMTSAIVLAIAPKVTWAWARPSLLNLPIPSYFVFGIATFVCGIVFFATVVPEQTLPTGSAPNGNGSIPTLALLLLPPGLFAISNVVLSWRIDRRIIRSRYQFGTAAIRDSVSLFVATVLYTVFYRACIILVFRVPWSHLPNIWIIWFVLGASALVIGYAVPGWAVNYVYPVRTVPRQITIRRPQS
jgi:hypothetical protein